MPWLRYQINSVIRDLPRNLQLSRRFLSDQRFTETRQRRRPARPAKQTESYHPHIPTPYT
jgi:hypothetical protein